MFDLSTLDVGELERLRDAVNRRILDLRRTTNLSLPDLLQLLEETKTTLKDQHKEWRSLERWQYMDGEVRFWLNPVDQDLYKTGWFTIDELIAWTRDRGTVMIEELDEDEIDPFVSRSGSRPVTWIASGQVEEPRAWLGKRN
jgi:hypothetical protein